MLTADEPRKKKLSSALGSNVRFTTASPDAVRIAAVKPAPVDSLKRFSAFRARPRSSHRNCAGYRRCDPSRFVWPSDPPLQGSGILRAVSANAQTQQRNVRGKLTVTRGSSIIVRMHPSVGRISALGPEPDHRVS